MFLRNIFEALERTGQGKSAVIGWGRGMGHRGHMFLASSVITQAKETGGDPYFVVSKTVGKDDPINPDEKLAIYKKVFPQSGHIFQTATDEMPDLTRVLTKLNQMGYTDATVVVGADQVNALGYVKNYNGKPDKAGNIPFSFNTLNVISRQETNDPSRDQEGPRATPMRAVLMDPAKSEEEKFAVWRDAMNPELSDDEVIDLMHKAEQRMKAMVKPKKGVAEGHPNQQISRYNPDGATYRGSYNKMPTLGTDDPVHHADRYGPEHDEPYEMDFDKEELKRVIAKGMSDLSDNAKRVLELRFWDDLTYDEIAAELSVSRERIRQIEAKALRQLKHPSRSDKLRSFVQAAESDSNAIANTASRLANKDDGKVAKLRAAGDKRREDQLKGRNIAKRDTTSKDEWGNLKELSNDALGRYKKAASADATAADKAGNYKRADKRFSGIVKATKKQFANDTKGVAEDEGDPKGVPHVTKELLKHIVQQVGTEGAHAIIKSLQWGDGAAKELLHLIVKDLKNDISMAESVKQRIDKSCWKGYKKQGTKMKGDTRVNNCVPVSESVEDIIDSLINKIITNEATSNSGK
jgi:RNA polymerase sigma factor (sigma-70 family)